MPDADEEVTAVTQSRVDQLTEVTGARLPEESRRQFAQSVIAELHVRVEVLAQQGRLTADLGQLQNVSEAARCAVAALRQELARTAEGQMIDAAVRRHHPDLAIVEGQLAAYTAEASASAQRAAKWLREGRLRKRAPTGADNRLALSIARFMAGVFESSFAEPPGSTHRGVREARAGQPADRGTRFDRVCALVATWLDEAGVPSAMSDAVRRAACDSANK